MAQATNNFSKHALIPLPKWGRLLYEAKYLKNRLSFSTVRAHIEPFHVKTSYEALAISFRLSFGGVSTWAR